MFICLWLDTIIILLLPYSNSTIFKCKNVVIHFIKPLLNHHFSFPKVPLLFLKINLIAMATRVEYWKVEIWENTILFKIKHLLLNSLPNFWNKIMASKYNINFRLVSY